MPSTSEVGHAKNVANLQKLTEQVAVYSLYNPPVDNLKVTNLTALYSTASAKISEVEEKRNANKNAITVRQSTFENLKPTCTKIINHLEILGLQQGTIDQAKSLNRLIQGGQKKTTTPPEEGKEIPKTISTSRQSYTQQTENFGSRREKKRKQKRHHSTPIHFRKSKTNLHKNHQSFRNIGTSTRYNRPSEIFKPLNSRRTKENHNTS